MSKVRVAMVKTKLEDAPEWLRRRVQYANSPASSPGASLWILPEIEGMSRVLGLELDVGEGGSEVYSFEMGGSPNLLSYPLQVLSSDKRFEVTLVPPGVHALEMGRGVPGLLVSPNRAFLQVLRGDVRAAGVVLGGAFG